MTQLLTRPGRAASWQDREGASLVLAAAVAATWATAMGLVGVVIAVLLVWTTAAHSGASVVDPVRGAVALWTYAHLGVLGLSSGPLGLLPLGFVALPAALLWRAGAGLARGFAIRDRRDAAVAVAALAAAYATLTALLGLASAGGEPRLVPVRAFLGGALLALAGGGGGLVRAAGLRTSLTPRLGPTTTTVLVAAAGGLLVLTAGAATLAGVSLAVSLSDAAAVHRALHPGAVGGAALFVVGLAAAPNAVVWAAAYAVGPGFAVGTGTVVSPFAVTLGPVPAFPLLAALPDGGSRPPAAPLVLGLPLLAAVVIGRLVRRRLGDRTVREVAVAAAAAGGAAGLLLGLAAALAGGAVGAARLAAVGPSPWQVAAAAGLELAAGAAGTVVVCHRWRTRTRG